MTQCGHGAMEMRELPREIPKSMNRTSTSKSAEPILMAPDALCFYRANEKPFGAFSNLFRRDMVVAGVTYACAEAAYQSLKPRDPRVRAWLLAAPSPSLLALAAHAIPSESADPAEVMKGTADALLGFHTRPGWSRLRYPWMMECLKAKFTQHDDLKELLLSTGNRQIVEAGRIDDDAGRRWGLVNGKGRNMLGRMATRLRAQFRGEAHFDPELDDRLADGEDDLRRALIERGDA